MDSDVVHEMPLAAAPNASLILYRRENIIAASVRLSHAAASVVSKMHVYNLGCFPDRA
jgi:hypothetical protein